MFEVPRGACDTHMHFYEANAPVPPGTFMPGIFTVEDYRAAVQKRLGLERVIVVQANAYRDDNTVVLDAIRKLGRSAKGVAVVKPDVADAELERLTRGGIRAVRIMTLHGGTLGFDVMDAVAARVHPFGWHVNLQLDGRELPKHEAQIRRLPGKFVIDHVGKFLEPVALDSAPFRSCWICGHRTMLGEARGAVRDFEDGSAEVRGREPPCARAGEARARAHAVGVELAASVGEAERSKISWLCSPTGHPMRTRGKILADNPAELYGF